MLIAVVRSVRPRQWVKNVLVLAAPLAAGEIFNAEVMRPTAVAFVLFCLSASAVYLVNDTIDVEEDRRHPRKRFRPIATGEVTVQQALIAAGVGAAVAGSTGRGRRSSSNPRKSTGSRRACSSCGHCSRLSCCGRRCR